MPVSSVHPLMNTDPGRGRNVRRVHGIVLAVVATALVTAAGFAFAPDSVDVSAGKVTLTVTNNDDTEHTFTLDDGSSNTNLPPGETQKIVLDLSATVGWHCTIHPSMTGTLNVG